MRIPWIHLENFRVHADSVLEIGDASFVCLRGRNGGGKTTIGQALSICMTSTTAGLDAQGRGFVSKIKRGQSKAVITAHIQTKYHLIQRGVTLNAGMAGRTQGSLCLSDPEWDTGPFEKRLEEQRAALSVVLNTDAFARMDEQKQKSLLAGLALPPRYDFDREIVAQVNQLLPGVVNFEGEPFAAINDAYKELFEERKIVNRQVREFVIPERLATPAGVDSVGLQEQLTRLHMLRREKDQERTQAVAEASKEESKRTQAKNKIQDAVDAEKRGHRALHEKLLSEGKLAYLLKMAEGKEELDRLRKEHAGLMPMRENYRQQLRSLQEAPRNATQCPTCEQAVRAEDLAALKEKLGRWDREIGAQLGQIEQKIQALGDVGVAVELLAGHEKAKQELAAFEAQAGERAKARKELTVPEAALFDFAPYEQGIAEIDAQIEQATLQLRPVIAAEERHKEIAVKAGQLQELEAKAGVLDGLVKYFDKDGIKAKLIGEYIGGFETKLNEVLGAWGYAAALTMEPYSFDVTNALGDVIPVRELSGAEKVMFSLAFQCAVARASGIGMVVIDEIATLLPEIRPMLYRRLYEMLRSNTLEQVFLLVADSSVTVPNLPGSAFFMIEKGTVTKLARQRLDAA